MFIQTSNEKKTVGCKSERRAVSSRAHLEGFHRNFPRLLHSSRPTKSLTVEVPLEQNLLVTFLWHNISDHQLSEGRRGHDGSAAGAPSKGEWSKVSKSPRSSHWTPERTAGQLLSLRVVLAKRLSHRVREKPLRGYWFYWFGSPGVKPGSCSLGPNFFNNGTLLTQFSNTINSAFLCQ